jgi:putative oxidoreductase
VSTLQTDAARHAHWILRIAIAAVFIPHGLDKLGDLSAFAEMTGMPGAVALLVALAEVGGSILILAGGVRAGWLTLVGAAALVPVMVGAIVMVHWGQWHFMATETHPMGGMQFQVTLLLVLTYLAASEGHRAGGFPAEADRARARDRARTLD